MRNLAVAPQRPGRKARGPRERGKAPSLSGFAGDDAELDPGRLRLSRLVPVSGLERRQRDLRRPAADACTIDRDCRQPRMAAARDVEVAEAGDGDPAGHVQAAPLTFGEHAEGGEIGDADDRVDVGPVRLSIASSASAPCAIETGGLPVAMIRPARQARASAIVCLNPSRRSAPRVSQVVSPPMKPIRRRPRS